MATGAARRKGVKPKAMPSKMPSKAAMAKMMKAMPEGTKPKAGFVKKAVKGAKVAGKTKPRGGGARRIAY